MAALAIDQAVLKRLDFSRALKDACAWPPSLMPSRVAETALADNRSYVQYVRSQAQHGNTVRPAEIVWVPKARDQYRPVAAMPFQDRALYWALVNRIVDELGPDQLPADDFEAFERQPLEAGTHPYVVLADVSNFYDQVDHSWISTSIVDATGLAEVAEILQRLLGAWSGRRSGLPQNQRPSAVLADLAISRVERAMLRKGWQVWRFNDDFRIGVRTRGAGSAALIDLAHELNRVGLTVNGEKSWILSRSRYRLHTEAVDKRVRAEFRRTGLNPEVATRYFDPGDMTAPPLPEYAGPGLRLLKRAVAVRQQEILRGLDLVVNRRIIVQALLLLAQARSTSALPFGPFLLRVDPSLTRIFVTYLLFLLANGESVAVRESLEQVIAELGPAAPVWQKAWLCQPLLAQRLELSPHLYRWARDLAQSPGPGALSIRGLIVLAYYGRLTVSDLVGAADRVGHASVLDAAAMAAALAGSSKAIDGLRTDREIRAVMTYASERGQDTSWM